MTIAYTYYYSLLRLYSQFNHPRFIRYPTMFNILLILQKS